MVDLPLRALRPRRAALALGLLLTACGGETDDPTPHDDSSTATVADPASPTTPSMSDPRRAPGAPDGPPTIPFTDVSDASGLVFTHTNGAAGEKLLPETMGGGCAFLDFDGDGDQDVLFVDGRPWDDDGSHRSLHLFRNDGAGSFEDASDDAGLQLSLQGMGAAIGDPDGDGDLDVFVTAVGTDALLRNDAGIFRDVTADAGVGGGADDWSTAATFADTDGDGDSDLVVGRYVEWSRQLDLDNPRELPGIPGRAYAPPMAFTGTHPVLYRNDGGLRFADVSEAAGLRAGDDADPFGKALAVVPFDLEPDGDVDLFVANDTTRNGFYVNAGDGTFTEQGRELALAYDNNGLPTGAMGVDVGHFANDERIGLFVGNFADEMSNAYVADGSRGFFADDTVPLGLGAPTRPVLSFGLLLADLDLDGRLDLVQVNGHLEDRIGEAEPGKSYAQATQLFWNTGKDAPRFRSLEGAAIGDLATPLVGRGLASADIDGDGDLDLLITQPGGRARLLRNDQASHNHWLRVVLRGGSDDGAALGARVRLRSGDVTQRRDVRPTRSYLAQCELPLTFGLGDATSVDELVVTWPDGSEQLVEVDAIDTTLVVRQPASAGEAARLINLSKAQLENGDADAAIAAAEEALALDPTSAAARRNLARAFLLAAEPERALLALGPLVGGDADDIDHMLSSAPGPDEPQAALSPEIRRGSAAILYLLGVAHARGDDPERAAQALAESIRLAPDVAAARFQLGLAQQLLGRDDEALVQFGETVRLDPSHAAAWYRLAVAARRAGDTTEFRRCNLEFLRLRELYGETYTTPVSLEACVHTRGEGPAGAAILASTPDASPLGVTFTDATDALLADAAPRSAQAIAALSMDADGRYTFVLADADGQLGTLAPGDDGRYAHTTWDHDVSWLTRVESLVVGNGWDDIPSSLPPDEIPTRLPDVFVTGFEGGALFADASVDGARDLSARSGLEDAAGHGATWTDIEHDGDLDLVVVGDGGFDVWQNNTDGSFELADESLSTPDAPPLQAVAAFDVDGNGGVDLVGPGPAGDGTAVALNRRGGRLEALPSPPGPWPAAFRVALDDFDGDGDGEALLLTMDGGLALFDDDRSVRVSDLPELYARALELIDVDGDGVLEALVAGHARDDASRGVARLFRQVGGRWLDVTAGSGLDTLALPAIADSLAIDLDDDDDSDLLLRGADGQLVLLTGTGAEGSLLKLRLVSLMSSGGGLGTRVELRAGESLITRTATRWLPVEIGRGGHARFDSVQSLWPNGVVDARIDVTPDDEPLTVAIIERADTGSCPFVYVWDGQRMRFITDMLGSGATGMPLNRDVLYPVDPHETIILGPADMLAPRDGQYAISMTGELREMAYIDEAELVFVDHEPDVEIHSTDILRGPPLEVSELIALANPRVPSKAYGDDGIDRTSAFATIDEVFGEAGPVRPAPFRGVCEPMTLSLEFDEALPVDGEPWLALTGWIFYGTASSSIALSQMSDVPGIWPTLRARDGDGVWHDVPDLVIGLPDGKTKTIISDLTGKLPPGCDALQLTTTFELRWDRVAVMERRALPAERIQRLRPDSAELQWHGFSELIVRKPGNPRTADFHNVKALPHWRLTLEGWCTSFGDVLPLLDAEDGKLVIMNSGEEIAFRFDTERVAPVPAGLTRTAAWYAVGYNKEGDPNNATGTRVWPLPVDTTYGRSDEEEAAWHAKWNRRFVRRDVFSGR